VHYAMVSRQLKRTEGAKRKCNQDIGTEKG
jgi:hypothetical protein